MMYQLNKITIKLTVGSTYTYTNKVRIRIEDSEEMISIAKRGILNYRKNKS